MRFLFAEWKWLERRKKIEESVFVFANSKSG